jgi:hypothetical protein
MFIDVSSFIFRFYGLLDSSHMQKQKNYLPVKPFQSILKPISRHNVDDSG